MLAHQSPLSPPRFRFFVQETGQSGSFGDSTRQILSRENSHTKQWVLTENTLRTWHYVQRECCCFFLRQVIRYNDE